jgi:hypothetical protein
MVEMIRALSPEIPRNMLPPWLASPLTMAFSGALLGLITGGVIGRVIDLTLNRLGAGPPLPSEETLVTVRTDEGRLEQVTGLFFRARARHLHVAGSAPT